MKIIIITQGVSRIVKPILQAFSNDIFLIIESAPRNYSQSLRLKYLATPLKKFCIKNNLPYLLYHKSNLLTVESACLEFSPDLIVVYSMSQLLPSSILKIPKNGCINLHPSILPSYRGPNPWFWAYYNNLDVSGVTIHCIDAGEDTGDIIAQQTFNIKKGIKSPELQDLAITTIGVPLLIQVIKNIKNNKLFASYPQPLTSPTPRARNLRDEDHNSLIDWQNFSVEHIWHILRGTELWQRFITPPTIWLILGQRWSIGNYVHCHHDYRKQVGNVLYHPKFKNILICRDGYILLRVQFSLKRAAKHLLSFALPGVL